MGQSLIFLFGSKMIDFNGDGDIHLVLIIDRNGGDAVGETAIIVYKVLGGILLVFIGELE